MGLVGLLLLAMCRGSSYDDLETRECVSVLKKDGQCIYVWSNCIGIRTQSVPVLKVYRYSTCTVLKVYCTQSVHVLKLYGYTKKCTRTQIIRVYIKVYRYRYTKYTCA